MEISKMSDEKFSGGQDDRMNLMDRNFYFPYCNPGEPRSLN